MLSQFIHLIIGFVAVMVALGGVMGYVKAKSMISLIMGVVSGIILGIFAFLSASPEMSQIGLFGSLALMTILDGMFAIRFAKTKKVMPNLVMIVILCPAMACVLMVLFKIF